MSTIDAAKALGMDQHIGSLSKGKDADIVAIDLSRIETQPVYDPVSHIVYASSRNQVTHVWVAGKQLLNDRELLTINYEEAMQNAIGWGLKLKANA